MNRQDDSKPGIDRRGILRLGFGALVYLGAAPVLARTTPLGRVTPSARTLALENVHTGERLRATYWEKGCYLPDALGEINRILRDYRTDEIVTMDTRLLDLLDVVRTTVGSHRPYEVISGYRSPATNAALLEEGHRVAGGSFHTLGMAIDVRLPDRSPAALRRAALKLRRGGVGYYRHPGFVHLDVGPVRHW